MQMKSSSRADMRDAIRRLRAEVLRDSPYSQVIPGLYVGAAEALNEPAFVERVGAVVSVLGLDEELRTWIRSRIGRDTPWLAISAHDSEDQDLASYFDETFAFIDDHLQRGDRVFVHCAAGHSRSVTIVAAYLMRKRGLGASDALATIKRARPCIYPNDGFLKQLLEFEQN